MTVYVWGVYSILLFMYLIFLCHYHNVIITTVWLWMEIFFFNSNVSKMIFNVLLLIWCTLQIFELIFFTRLRKFLAFCFSLRDSIMNSFCILSNASLAFWDHYTCSFFFVSMLLITWIDFKMLNSFLLFLKNYMWVQCITFVEYFLIWFDNISFRISIFMVMRNIDL